MFLRRMAVVCVVVLCLPVIAAGQTCPQFSPPYGYVNPSCGTSGSFCTPGSTVTLVFNPYSWSNGVEACDTITWQFGDGTSPITTGTAPVTHTYVASGTFNAVATVQNSLGSSYQSAYVTVGYGSFSVDSYLTVLENAGSATVTVRRTSSVGTASINYSTVDGSAHAGTNYTATSGTLTFNAGESTKTISVPIIDNSVFTGSSLWFNMNFSSPTSGWLMNSTVTQVSITDDEPPPTFAFSQSTYTVSESVGNATITVNRTGDMTQTASVQYTAYLNSYVSGTLTFAPNETSHTFTLPITNDDVYTGTRSYTVQMYGIGFSRVPNGYATLNVTDDDPQPEIIVDDVWAAEGDSGQKLVTFNIHLSGHAVGAVSIYPSLTQGTARFGTDFTSDPSAPYSITFAQGETLKTYTAKVIGNTKPEPNKTFSLSVQLGYSYGGAPKLTKAAGVCTIVNDDHAATPYLQQMARGQIGSVNLALGQGPATSGTIAVVSSDPSVASVPATVNVAANQANVIIPVTAKTVGGAVITATLPPSLDSDVVKGAVSVYEGAAVNVTPPSVSVSVGATANVSVNVDPAQSSPTTLFLAAVDSSVATVPTSVSIPPGQTATFAVTGAKIGTTTITITSSLTPQPLSIPVAVVAAPVGMNVTSATPSSGPAAGGTAVTISGANFTAPCSVTFGGAPAAAGAATAASIAVTTPAHAAGSVDVVVTCGNTSATLPNGFTYRSSGPTLSAISPSFGSTSGGTVTRISGDGFDSNCWPFFGTTGGHSATVLNPKEIVVSTPAHAAESVDISVRCGSGLLATLSNAFAFTAGDDAAPVISSLSPLNGSPGEAVTISGIRFRNTDKVTFDGTPAVVRSTAPDSHVVTVPELPLGKVSINVTDTSGRTSTSGPIFTVLEPLPPRISSVSPSRIGAGGELIINGTGFRAVYAFALDGTKLMTVNLSPNRAVARVPLSMAAGTYPLNALNPAGQIAAIGDNVTVVPNAPAITGVAAGCATADGGVTVHISGIGFVSGAAVTFDGVAANSVIVQNGSMIAAVVPPGTPGSAIVVVTNPDGTTATFSNGFRYVSPFDPDGCAPRSHAATH